MSHLLRLGAMGIVLSCIISYLPTIIAYLKKNDNKLQEAIYQTIIFIFNLVVCFFINHLPRIFIFNIIRNVWDIAFIVLWLYFFICSLLDKKMPRP